MLYKNGKVSEIDKGYIVTPFIGTENKIYYSVIYEEKQPFKHFVKDLRTGKSWPIGKNEEFTYPFFSEKGDRLVVVLVNPKYRTIGAYYGDEKENYRLRKFLHNTPMGPIKLSADGKVYMIMLPKGIQVGYF